MAGENTEEAKGLQKDLVILYTGDVHCGVNDNFTYAGLEEVRNYYDSKGYYTLLADVGDSVQGGSIGTVTKGEAVRRLMNEMKYDLAIPGNHDFDYGMDQFFNLTEMADYPYISCNFNKEGELVFEPYIIKEFDGVKIGFVGVTTPQTLTTSTPTYFQDEKGNYIYGFMEDKTGEKLYKAVQDAVDSVRAEGADYVILLAHLGNETTASPWTYAEVVAATTGIDAVLDSHSHDLDQVVMKNKNGEDVIRSASGTKLQAIGYLIIPADTSKKMSANVLTWNNPVSVPDLFRIQNDMKEAVDEELGNLNEMLNETVAYTSVDLTINDPEAVDKQGAPVRIVRAAETNLGDLCTDAYRIQTGADIGYLNAGSIRTSIPKGDITRSEILDVHPFGNAICVVKMKGQKILDALEWGCRTVPEENGAFPQVSNVTYEIHTYIPSPCQMDEHGLNTGFSGEYRVKNVTVGGEPLDPEKEYTLATNNYILKEHGDGYSAFDGAEILVDDKLDNQVLIDYIVDTLGGEISTGYENPYGDGRIIAVDTKPAEKTAENDKAA
jgi:2',3'-cyclic-nucleotide 2'-phosphodiesterase (5'-nucleotidase family)